MHSRPSATKGEASIVWGQTAQPSARARKFPLQRDFLRRSAIVALPQARPRTPLIDPKGFRQLTKSLRHAQDRPKAPDCSHEGPPRAVVEPCAGLRAAALKGTSGARKQGGVKRPKTMESPPVYLSFGQAYPPARRPQRGTARRRRNLDRNQTCLRCKINKVSWWMDDGGRGGAWCSWPSAPASGTDGRMEG